MSSVLSVAVNVTLCPACSVTIPLTALRLLTPVDSAAAGSLLFSLIV